MKFEDFKRNVEQWAEVRGIYEQSTEAKQVEKFQEELWEFFAAKNDEDRADAVGDMAVCIVNASHLCTRSTLSLEQVKYYDAIQSICGSVIAGHYTAALILLKRWYDDADFCLGYDFEDCLGMAWNEIKDRKGMMINGLFVKWENLTAEQQEELQARLDSHIEADC